MVRVGAVADEDLGQVLPVGACGREERRESAGLRGVGIGAMGEQEPDRCGIAAQGDGRVERLVMGRVLRPGIDLRAVLQQHVYGLGGAERCGKMQRRPSISRKGMGCRGVGGEDIFEAQQHRLRRRPQIHRAGRLAVASWARRYSRATGWQEYTDHSNADTPLGSRAWIKCGIGLDGGSDLRGGAGLDQLEEVLAHFNIQSTAVWRRVCSCGVGPGQGGRFRLRELSGRATGAARGAGSLGKYAELDHQIDEDRHRLSVFDGGLESALRMEATAFSSRPKPMGRPTAISAGLPSGATTT